MSGKKPYVPNGKSGAEIRAHLDAIRDSSILVTSCAFCEWTYEGTALEGRELVDSLTSILRRIDKTTDSLAEHGLTVSTDLGPVGNAAASVRRDLEKQKPGPTFRMPAGA